MVARLKSDELYRCVYKRADDDIEPNWEYLHKEYKGRLGHMVIGPVVNLVHPYSSLMVSVTTRIEEIYVAHNWPRDVDTPDASLDTFDEPPVACD
jgi:hypothetical protein